MADQQGPRLAAGALDEPSEDDDDEDDALEELNELAAEERRRNPKLTKQAAFTKVYTDPANASSRSASAGPTDRGRERDQERAS